MRALWLALLMGLMLAGCATPSRPDKMATAAGANPREWQGRISVQVQGDTPSAMSASFLLRGNASHGELDLYSPLGTTVGALQWSPQFVQLSNGNTHQHFNSLAELTAKTTGAALPIDALFSWLQGRDVPVSGWQADLSGMSQGTLSAKRTDPTPEVTLRIKLDQ
jgi:outer membrane lipoprotein LolB